MTRHLCAAVVVFAVLLTGSAPHAGAAPIEYDINFGPNFLDADGGVGSFFWDPSTHLISNFTWDFGGGNTGGIDDAGADWTFPLFGGTKAEFLFEILTFVDVHPEPCSTPAWGCGVIAPPSVFGYPGGSFFFEDVIGTNEQRYRLFGFVEGSFETKRAPVVPEPGMLALFGAAACGLFRWGRSVAPTL